MRAIILTLFGSLSMVSAMDLQLTFEKPRQVSAISVSQSDKKDPIVRIFGTYELTSRGEELDYKAKDVLFMVAAQGNSPEFYEGGHVQGYVKKEQLREVLRFDELQSVRQIDVHRQDEEMVLYVFTVEKVWKVRYPMHGEVSKEVVPENSAPKSKARLRVLKKADGGPPIIERNQAEPQR